MAPEQFHAMMDEKKDGCPKIQFTVEADRAVIKGLYDKTFGSIIGRAAKFEWSGLGWEYELHELVPALLVAAGTLTKLDLSQNKLRGASWACICVESVPTHGSQFELSSRGAGSLPKEIGNLMNLTSLHLASNALTGACLC